MVRENEENIPRPGQRRGGGGGGGGGGGLTAPARGLISPGFAVLRRDEGYGRPQERIVVQLADGVLCRYGDSGPAKNLSRKQWDGRGRRREDCKVRLTGQEMIEVDSAVRADRFSGGGLILDMCCPALFAE